MTSIKSLPEAVRSSVRSGVIIYDLTRVVEELIFNSLDAGASKVSIFVGIGTCYVKVVDNGLGVPRDGLLLMGERYATSKFDDLTDEHAASKNFGFRGEALASISDVSLLEIVSKANGKPNGYRKVMKGSKCLFLGIDNDRKDVGTTVSVRDLYYNQPVRRKYTQSSPKKVLQSVKKCVLRIALMHSQVSFEVINIESEDMLLCTRPSSTLSLLTGAFGMEIATSLHEVSMDDGNFKLFGYISGPCDNLTIKAFQYVYINSRFIYKGPVHKVLNQLAARFELWGQATITSGQQSRKRNRSQVYPAFILNISCHRSFYDLTFESSKTFVHFKDFVAVQMFIDKAIQTLWREDIFYGSASPMGHVKGKEQMSSGHGNILSPDEDLLEKLPKNFINEKKMCTAQNRQASLELPVFPSKLIAIEDDYGYLSCAEHDVVPIQFSNQNPDDLRDQARELDFGLSRAEDDVVPIQFSSQNTDDLRDQELELDFGCENDSSFWDFSLARSKPKASRKHENHQCISGDNFLSAEEFYLENRVTAMEQSGSSVEKFTLPWENENSKVNFIFGNGSAVRDLPCDNEGFGKNLEKSQVTTKPFLKSCSSIYSNERELCMDGELDFQNGVFWAREIGTGHYNLEIDDEKQSFDFSSRSLLQDHGSITQTSRDMTNYHLSSEFDSLPRELVKPIPSYADHVDKINGFPSGSVKNTASTGLNAEWFSVNLKPSSQLVPWDPQHSIDNDILGGSCRSSGNHFIDTEENNCRLSFGTMSKSAIRENCTTSCKNSQLDYACSSKFLQRHNLNNNFPPECSDLLIDETDWLDFGLHHTNHFGIERYETQRNWIPHQGAKKIRFKQRSRSSSAPPFYRRKRRISALKYPSTVTEDEPHAPICPDNGDMTHLHQSSGIGYRHLKPSVSKNLLDPGRDMKNMQDFEEKTKIQKDEQFIPDTEQVTGLASEEFQESPNNSTKWPNGYPLTTTKNKLHNIHNANNILDISSGFLYFAGDSLLPGSIDKNFLDEARVLQQLDKKFIPVVAGRTLAVIDQHAADERIRLEELRQKVISGEAKTISFLDAEQELMLPEIGHQLLQNYAEMIQEWGWICNIHVHDPMSFKRNLNLLHSQPTVITLIAVPCIVGVNLTDTDLMEFLQQLADTDGSSTMPPSVLRILNSKACRGAIMFGDSLLPSECSLIVEELKKTSLCFQCAHGRPTTVPLINLEVLHKQIANISLLSGEDNILLWHGLCRHELSLERAMRRLKSR